MSTHTHKLIVEKVVLETSDTISISFQNPKEGKLPYVSGQYLTLIAHIDGKEVRRAYSLSSSFYTDAYPTVAVKKLENGLMSNYLLANCKAGLEIEVLYPMGNFILEPSESLNRQIYLFGAGSGITPLYSMAKTVLSQEPNSVVTLVYGNRSIESIIYKAELEALAHRYPANFQIVHCLTSPPEKWYGASGRIGTENLSEILAQTSAESTTKGKTEYFMCGPAQMMDSITNYLLAQEINKDNIHKESFFTSVTAESKQAAIEEEGIITRNVTVIWEDEKHTFEVKPSQTILEAALDLDIDLPYSCQSGLCTACRGKCTSGKVHLDEREGLSDKEMDQGYILTCVGLSDKEMDQGYILTCVGHPLTSNVVIEIG